MRSEDEDAYKDGSEDENEVGMEVCLCCCSERSSSKIVRPLASCACEVQRISFKLVCLLKSVVL